MRKRFASLAALHLVQSNNRSPFTLENSLVLLVTKAALRLNAVPDDQQINWPDHHPTGFQLEADASGFPRRLMIKNGT